MPSSVDTPGSLLERLRRPGDEEAWQRFVHLYTPLLFQWGDASAIQNRADIANSACVCCLHRSRHRATRCHFELHQSFALSNKISD